MNAHAAEQPKRSSGIMLKIILAVILLVVVVYFGFTCTVREGDCAVVLRFGAPRQEIAEPGLYFKLPWPFETVYTYDSRLQYFESGDVERLTNDSRNLTFNFYALWSVEDPLLFHNRFGNHEKGAMSGAELSISTQISDAAEKIIGNYDLAQVVSLDTEQIKTAEIQEKIFEEVKKTCKEDYGIEISDVSILRIFFPNTNLESIFEQMRTERQKDIDGILANARKEADILTAQTDEKYSEIIAAAQKEAAEINKKTAADVAAIYAQAQQANTELYTFLKELDSIIASVSSDTVLVVTAETYPFNVLLDYGEKMANEETVITDLQYILTKIKQEDPQVYDDFVDKIYELLKYSGEVKSEETVKNQISYVLRDLEGDTAAKQAFVNEVLSALDFTYTQSEDTVINDLVKLLERLKKNDTAESDKYESFVGEVKTLVGA